MMTRTAMFAARRGLGPAQVQLLIRSVLESIMIDAEQPIVELPDRLGTWERVGFKRKRYVFRPTPEGIELGRALLEFYDEANAAWAKYREAMSVLGGPGCSPSLFRDGYGTGYAAALSDVHQELCEIEATLPPDEGEEHQKLADAACKLLDALTGQETCGYLPQMLSVIADRIGAPELQVELARLREAIR